MEATPRSLSPSTMLVCGLGGWILYAGLFVLRSPAGAFNHDLPGHVGHTRILYNEHRLALPREGWETYQPPLYYLVNTFFSPNHPDHIFKVRWISVIYGALSLLLMSRGLTRCRVSPPTQALVLFFIATTPAFMFMFTTYNNDSLATLFSIGILVMAFEWIDTGRAWNLLLLGVMATAGLYTKLSVLYPIVALLMIFCFLGLARINSPQRVFAVLKVLCMSLFLLTPWLFGHNYRLTGQFTPVPADFPLFPESRLPASPLRTLFTPPGVSPGEWHDPYVHVWDRTHHKKNSYLAFLFTTSVFDEYTFEFLPRIIPWSMILLHAVLWVAVLVRRRHSPDGARALATIILGILLSTTLFFRAPYASLMDFRYVAWIWFPMAVLYAHELVSSTSPARPPASVQLFRALMFSGIFIQGIFWAAMIIGGRWNIPL